mmetsp:Transcript_55784/g.160286  ORF Transcript_55784/g.160286 Transcript_55784/m.160286 type:complete len:224 (+) Transcript_55784:420-1091(+)
MRRSRRRLHVVPPVGGQEQSLSTGQHGLGAGHPQCAHPREGVLVGGLQINTCALVVRVVHWEGIQAPSPRSRIEDQHPLGAPDLQKDVVVLVEVRTTQGSGRTHEELGAEPLASPQGRPQLWPEGALLHGLVQLSLERGTRSEGLSVPQLILVQREQRRLQVVAVRCVVARQPQKVAKAEAELLAARQGRERLRGHLAVCKPSEVVGVLPPSAFGSQNVARTL